MATGATSPALAAWQHVSNDCFSACDRNAPFTIGWAYNRHCRGYGVVVLIVECLGASTVIVYGVNLLFVSVVPEHEVRLPACGYELPNKALAPIALEA